MIECSKSTQALSNRTSPNGGAMHSLLKGVLRNFTRLYWLTMRLYRMTMPLHRVTMPLHRVTMPLHRVTMQLYRMTMRLYRVTMPLHQVVMRSHRLIAQITQHNSKTNIDIFIVARVTIAYR
jgi:hypothetical protein